MFERFAIGMLLTTQTVNGAMRIRHTKRNQTWNIIVRTARHYKQRVSLRPNSIVDWRFKRHHLIPHPGPLCDDGFSLPKPTDKGLMANHLAIDKSLAIDNLRDAGYSERRIAKPLGVSWGAVRRHLAGEKSNGTTKQESGFQAIQHKRRWIAHRAGDF